MTIDLDSLEKMTAELPDDGERQQLVHLIAESKELDLRVKQLLTEEEKKNARLKKQSALIIPIFVLAALASVWYLWVALADGSITNRGRIVLKSEEPLAYWFGMVWPIAGAIVFPVGLFYMITSQFFRRPKSSIQETPRQ